MKKIIFFLILFCSLTVFADAPVENLTGEGDDNSSMPLDARVAKLEQQMANYSQMNLVAQINQLQQQVQELQGQLAEQAHQIQTVQNQQNSYYQDLSQRLNQAKPNVATATTTTDNATKTPTTDNLTADISDQKSYQKAFSLMQSKEYEKATSAFQEYIKQFPQGQYAANSHYWLGEIYFIKSKQKLAIEEFQTIITQYPKDSKVPDAMLKIAFMKDTAGTRAEAHEQLKKIIKEYPNSSAAQLAALRLKAE